MSSPLQIHCFPLCLLPSLQSSPSSSLHNTVTRNCPDQHCTPCARHRTNSKDGSRVVGANVLVLLSSLAISGNPQIKMVLLLPLGLEALLQSHSWLERHKQQQLLLGSSYFYCCLAKKEQTACGNLKTHLLQTHCSTDLILQQIQFENAGQDR